MACSSSTRSELYRRKLPLFLEPAGQQVAAKAAKVPTLGEVRGQRMIELGLGLLVEPVKADRPAPIR